LISLDLSWIGLAMISIGEAKKIIKDNLPPKKTTSLFLEETIGKVLAEDIFAPEPSPRFTNSAMDGFAVRWADVNQRNDSQPLTLSIIGESKAGNPFGEKMHIGQAVRISTGAMLPEGSDTVIRQEDTQFDNSTVRIHSVKKRHQNVRFEGEEFKTGDLLLKIGTCLQPPEIGLLASMGIASVAVFLPPKVSVITTGSELVSSGFRIKPGQIWDSNRIMIGSAITQAGGELALNEIVGDNLEETQKLVKKASQKSDIIIFSGGVSVGPHDFVKKAAEREGFKTLFWKVSQKPGKPLFFARKEDALLFGLPGNPVSAYMCHLFYILPVIEKLQGIEKSPKVIQGEMNETIENKIDRVQLFRIRLVEAQDGKPTKIQPVEKQGSHMLSSLTTADGFIILETEAQIQKGELAEVFLF
jgi:molybdopterin molybdotransferase